MPEQDFDKTEQASPHKLREAHNRGQVSKSLEINHLIVVGSFFLALLMLWPRISTLGREFVQAIIRTGPNTELTTASASRFAEFVVVKSMEIVLPLLIVLVIAAIVANVLQTKFVFSGHPIKPDFNRLNPAQGFKKLFNRKTLFDLFKTVLRLILLAFVIGVGGSKLLTWLNSGVTQGLQNVDDWLVALLVQVMLLVLVIMVPVVMLDWLFTKKYFAHQMKMSRREVRDELKRHEGSPEIRSRRKELQKELRKKVASLRAIKDADVIVTNPIHVAVALRYVRSEMAAPVIVAVGMDELSATVRKLGRQYNKPILRRPALARALAKHGSPGNPIPGSTYEQVAEIYRWLYQDQQQPA